VRSHHSGSSVVGPAMILEAVPMRTIHEA
jgi:hypothetical protein